MSNDERDFDEKDDIDLLIKKLRHFALEIAEQRGLYALSMGILTGIASEATGTQTDFIKICTQFMVEFSKENITETFIHNGQIITPGTTTLQ
jgi:hypothetical protein